VTNDVEKRVSWAELYFDLVFVFAVTEVSGLLHDDHSWAGLLRALIVFVPIYWVWVGTTIQTDIQDLTGPRPRLMMFGVALAGLFMALTVPDAYGSRAVAFALSYWGARFLLGAVMSPVARWKVQPVSISIVVTGPLLVAGALVHGTAREAIWGLAAFVDLANPAMLRARLGGMRFDPGHLAERFGLFVLIALGESVVAIGAAAHANGPLDAGVAGAVAAAFAVTTGLWWVYFNFAADAMRHALATAAVQLDITRRVLSYGHLAFIAAIIAVAVGLHEAVAHPGDELAAGTLGLLFGGSALYLASFGYTRWMMFRLVSTTRLAATGVVVVAMFPARLLPATAALALLAVVLIGLNTIEWMRVNQIGWRARLSRREQDGSGPDGVEHGA
jgi:low temperature requirement protein LtrA